MKKTPPLIACILMDMIGYATYSIPVIGELADIIWAPISALVFFMMFRGWKGAFGGIFSFVEEIMPGLDFIPTFTLAWVWQYFSKPKDVTKGSANTIYLNKSGKAYPVTNR
jgi:hypothetical protein